MNKLIGSIRRGKVAAVSAMALVLIGSAAPALAQDTLAEARIRRMEAEIRALQRQVFPGGDGKFFTPEITRAPTTGTPAPGQPATTPITDLLSRMETVEAQLARLTAQIEQNGNRITQLEARLGPVAAVPADAGTATTTTTTTTTTPTTPAPTANLSAMTGGASAPKPVTPAVATPSSQRVAAVRAIEKPQTSDPADDEYNYGFRLWEAKFYPEAQQQLKLYLEKYPRHSRASYARNLLGRAYLDEGKPREAATWFLQNFQADKQGGRAADSLLYLAATMKQLNDNNRTCIALAEFRETYAAEAAGRLKGQYDATRNGVTCSR